MTTAVLSPVTDYARKVDEGEIVAGKWVRLACRRHINDMARSKSDPSWGYYFDDDAAQHAIDFFERVLCLTEGEFAHKPFLLHSFQKFIVGSLFGWKNAEGYRRFRTAYVETGKGSGKSPMAAGIGLYGLTMDGEAGAEVYAAAVTRDQAKILFSDAEKMAQDSTDLAAELEFTVNNIAHPSSHSFFRAISAEARALDGKRVHMALIDEIHEHPNAMVVDKMRAGTKNRRQALIFEITNSGYDRNSVCYQHHLYSTQILEGIIDNEEWFSYICTLDACGQEGHTTPVAGCPDCDDWTDESTWIKVQPGLDTIMPRKYMREQVAEALGMPSKLNIVLRLNFCVWTETAERWIDMAAWDACDDPLNPADLLQRQCFAGLDLSSTWDVTAFVMVFPDHDGGYSLVPMFWVPEENMRVRARKDRVPYDVWVREGWIKATPGNVVDYDMIRADINELAKSYDIREVAIDRWNSTQLQTQLMGDGFTIVPFGQGFASMTAPAKEFERAIMDRKTRHGGNPVMRWMVSNLAAEQDAAGNLKPSKKVSTEKIDGPVAAIMALGRAIVSDDGISVYESQKLEAW